MLYIISFDNKRCCANDEPLLLAAERELSWIAKDAVNQASGIATLLLTIDYGAQLW